MSAQDWPAVPEGEEWVLELIEERFERTTQTPRELRARAEQLRAQADETEIEGVRAAALALAARYDDVAASKVGS